MFFRLFLHNSNKKHFSNKQQLKRCKTFGLFVEFFMREIWMTSTSEFVSNENSRRKILEKIREQNVPNSQLFQEFLVEYELLAEYRLLQVNFDHIRIL